MAKRKVILKSKSENVELHITAIIKTNGILEDEICAVKESVVRGLFDLARGSIIQHNPLLQDISIK